MTLNRKNVPNAPEVTISDQGLQVLNDSGIFILATTRIRKCVYFSRQAARPEIRAETNILVIRIFVSKCSIWICFQQPADSFAHTQ